MKIDNRIKICQLHLKLHKEWFSVEDVQKAYECGIIMGVFIVIQELWFNGEDTLAEEIVNSAALSKKDLLRLVKQSGWRIKEFNKKIIDMKHLTS